MNTIFLILGTILVILSIMILNINLTFPDSIVKYMLGGLILFYGLGAITLGITE